MILHEHGAGSHVYKSELHATAAATSSVMATMDTRIQRILDAAPGEPGRRGCSLKEFPKAFKAPLPAEMPLPSAFTAQVSPDVRVLEGVGC